MVLEILRKLLIERVGCEAEDVEMAADLDELNVTDDERVEVAMILWEMFVSEPMPDEFPAWELVEDLVGYIEDRMG